MTLDLQNETLLSYLKKKNRENVVSNLFLLNEMKSRLPALMIMNRHDLGTLCSLYAFISQIFQSQTLYKNQT